MVWNGAGGWLIFSQDRQLNFSRTCSVTNNCRGTTSSVSVTSSPIFESLVPPQHGQQAGAGCTMRRYAGRLARGRILARGRRQFLELQFQLIEQALAALGTRAEQLALHLGDHQLQVLDQGLGAGEFGARLDQRSLQRILVVRNMINCRRHKSIESQSPLIRWSSRRRFNNRTQPAADGRQLCSG